MRINFYDTRLSDDGRITLIKEKGINYETNKEMNNPENITLMGQDLLNLGELAEEYCYMIAFNSACKVLGIFFISKGTVNASLVSPREVYLRSLLIGASHIVLLHNHPSGNAVPSDSDIKLTRQLEEVGRLVNIKLVDHIITGSNKSYFSFREAGLLDKGGDVV